MTPSKLSQTPPSRPETDADLESRIEVNPKSKSKDRPIWLNVSLFLLAVAASAIVYVAMPAEVPEPARRMASIFMLALVLWVTEPIPLFATALFVILGESWLLAVSDELHASYKTVLVAFADPIIWIFLGGFVMAKAVQQERIDQQLAGLMLRPFGTHPASVLAGLMVITALFSMFMSNTATTAMMIILVFPLLRQLPPGEPFRKALVLAIPFSANIGGIGTPIGTPPNAVALGQIKQVLGVNVTFGQWMACAMPLMLGAVVVMWFTLYALYRPRDQRLHLELPRDSGITRNGIIVYSTFTVTVLLWLTDQIHGIPTAVVAVLPMAVLSMTRVIGRREFNSLEWDVLMLIAGGIALGAGISQTGLDTWIVGLIPSGGMSLFAIGAVVVAVTIALSTVMSNTVAANLIIPVAMVIASSKTPMQREVLAIMAAIASSFAMGLPISTPPNAIAYVTGEVSSRDMLLVGGLCSVIAALVIVFTGPTVVSLIFSALN